MTNKMKVIFAIVSTVSFFLIVMLCTPFAIDTCGSMLSEVLNALGLHESSALSALAVLVIPGLYLYLALGQRRRSYLGITQLHGCKKRDVRRSSGTKQKLRR